MQEDHRRRRGAQGAVGPQGPQGPQGPRGETGTVDQSAAGRVARETFEVGARGNPSVSETCATTFGMAAPQITALWVPFGPEGQ